MYLRALSAQIHQDFCTSHVILSNKIIWRLFIEKLRENPASYFLVFNFSPFEIHVIFHTFIFSVGIYGTWYSYCWRIDWLPLKFIAGKGIQSCSHSLSFSINIDTLTLNKRKERQNSSYGTFNTYIVSWPTVVEGDPKVPFSIATTPRCRGERNSFLWIAPFTVDPYLIMLRVKQGDIKYYFLSLWNDTTRDWVVVSRTIGEHFNHYANGLISANF